MNTPTAKWNHINLRLENDRKDQLASLMFLMLGTLTSMIMNPMVLMLQHLSLLIHPKSGRVHLWTTHTEIMQRVLRPRNSLEWMNQGATEERESSLKETT